MRRCKHCGARGLIPISNCDFCGTPYGQGFGCPLAGAEISGSRQRGFEQLLQHPDFDKAVAQGPIVEAPPKHREQPYLGYLLLFAVFPQFYAFSKALGFSEKINAFSVMSLIVICWILAVLWRLQARARAYPGTHLESLPARLSGLSVKSKAMGGGVWKVQIEQPSGEGRHLRYHGPSAGEWKEGDFGVAHIKANVLVEFQRLSV